MALPPPPPPPTPDSTRPLLRELALAPARFHALSAGASIVARRGSRVSYTLSEPAAVSFSVQLVVGGRRVSGRCVQAKRSNRRAKRCDRYRALSGSFAAKGAAGTNTLHFSGRLLDRTLAAGRYRLRAVARDAAGNRSRAQLARFGVDLAGGAGLRGFG